MGAAAAFAATAAAAVAAVSFHLSLCPSLLQAVVYGGGGPPAIEGPPSGALLGSSCLFSLGASAVDAYFTFVASHSFSVCLPFRLRVVGAPIGGPSDASIMGAPGPETPGRGPLHNPIGGAPWLGELYAVEVFFSDCPSYRPLLNVRIPFLQSPLGGPKGPDDPHGVPPPGSPQQHALGGPLTEEEERALQEAAEKAFPFVYEIILK